MGKIVFLSDVDSTFARTKGAKDKGKRVFYRGRYWTPNRPVASDRAGKKKMVLASKNVGGKTKYKLIHFGAKGYSDYTKHKDKSRRANYRARHSAIKLKSGKPAYKDKFQAAYWSYRKLW